MHVCKIQLFIQNGCMGLVVCGVGMLVTCETILSWIIKINKSVPLCKRHTLLVLSANVLGITPITEN
jgi:hypothetical protein